MQKYKIFATLIQMFDPNFMNNLQQAFGDNPWPVKLINWNYRTHSLHQTKYLLGMNKTKQYSLVEVACKKWLEIKSDLDDNK
jgi:hypothetical protein